MMPWVRSAVEAAVTGDTQSSVVQATSTVSIIKLLAGQVAAQGWARDDILRYAAVSGTGTNHDATARVVSIAGDNLTIDPPLDAGPTAGDSVLAGANDWLAPAGGFVYWKNALTSSAAALFEAVRDTDCVIAYGDPVHRPEIFTRVRSPWAFIVLGREPASIEALTWRIFQRLNHRIDRLVVTGRDVYECVVDGSELQQRGDDLHQRLMNIEIVSASEDGRP